MRFGLLGTGPWAESTHATGLSEHPDAEFTGVWGRRPEAAAALAKRFGTRAYDDVDALLADTDAIAIALPPAVQAPLAARAAAAGCHLLLDKPLATTGEDARRVVEAADRAGVASVVFFTSRFDAETAAWIDAQASVDGWFTARADWLGSVFSSGDSPFAASPWRREKGALWDVGPHALSVLLPVLGDVDRVTAARGPGDTVHLVLRHVSGASSSLALSLTAPPPAAGVAVELRGAAGTVTFPPRGGGSVAAFARAIDALVTAAGTGRPHPCDARFGLAVTELLETAELSLPD
jgi:predicted dehydrogenase